MATVLAFILSSALLFVSVAGFEEAHDGYLFIFHEDNNLVLVEKDDVCHFFTFSDLVMHSMWHTDVTRTEDELIMMLNGTKPSVGTPVDAAATQAKYNDSFAQILCHGRTMFQIDVNAPSVSGPGATTTAAQAHSTSAPVVDHDTIPGLNCSFEQGLCGWTQGHTDNLDWTVGQGSTPTSNTGPSADHTLNSGQGHYMYLEATGTAPKEAAELLSPTFTLTSDMCVSLWYNMYGDDIDTLEILTKDAQGQEVKLWSLSGNQGQGWHKVDVTLTPSGSQGQLMIRAKTGDSVLSDIAVDDVLALPGACPGFVTTECQSAPCQHGGSCTQGLHNYTCVCAPGYTGLHCGVAMDKCASNPCHNNATCTNGIYQYTCQCAPGFAGTNCETDVDDCSPNPCQNGGTCADRVNDVQCTCRAGYYGKLCSQDVNECESSPCEHGGTCVDGDNSFTCVCQPGYIGLHCETGKDDCMNNPHAYCENGATCQHVNNNTYHCHCPAGYHGTRCELEINECASSPCHRGTCQNLNGSFHCHCYAGYYGHLCETACRDHNNQCAAWAQHGECENNPDYMHVYCPVSCSLCGTQLQQGNCGSHQLHCHFHNRCIYLLATCNGIDDCGDNSDETLPECPDDFSLCQGQHQWRCDNGQCVTILDLCDGHARCHDRSDETHCHDTNCPRGAINCLNVPHKCVAPEHRCDGSCQCPGYGYANGHQLCTDEDNCYTQSQSGSSASASVSGGGMPIG